MDTDYQKHTTEYTTHTTEKHKRTTECHCAVPFVTFCAVFVVYGSRNSREDHPKAVNGVHVTFHGSPVVKRFPTEIAMKQFLIEVGVRNVIS